jgi:hypothetical protein
MTRKTLVAGAVVAAMVFSACGSDKKSGTTATTTKGGKGGLAVYTVAPLKDIVTTFVTSYNKAHKLGQLKVVVASQATIAKAASGTRNQIDIYVAPIKKLVKSAKKGVFGRSPAILAVSTANPHKVTGLTAFAATSGLKTQVCGMKTILGNFTALVLSKNKIKPNPATLAFDCEAKALADVASGKLDAALMFRAGTKLPSGVKKFIATKFSHGILTREGYLP